MFVLTPEFVADPDCLLRFTEESPLLLPSVDFRFLGDDRFAVADVGELVEMSVG